MGRGQELESDLKGERVMGAGKGPSPQFDVVTEVRIWNWYDM